MSKRKRVGSHGKETLKLTRWELENLHLPPVTTVTLYEGAAPVEYLRHRLAMILETNPWLTSRLVKKQTADGVVALTYAMSLDPESVVDRHFLVHAPGEVGLSLGMPYENLVHSLLPVQCARSKPAIDEDEPLFKVTVIPIAAEETDDSQAAPLLRAMTLPAFALVVSMNHTLGDGHTYYRLYGMLSADAGVEALDPVRLENFEEAKAGIIGEKENAMFASAGLGLGILGSYLVARFTRRKPQNVCIHSVDPAWVAQEKADAEQENLVPFVSTNDALTSWFFREMKSDMNIMVANFRSRKPSILDLDEQHAGNYEANVPYFKGDVETPVLIRQSIRNVDGSFRARRAGLPATEVLSFMTLVRNNSAIITNWATFYRDVILQGNEALPHKPKLHLPIMAADGIITSVWNNGIVFRPREGETAMLLITRRFDSDMLIQRKAHDGSSVPLGARIV